MRRAALSRIASLYLVSSLLAGGAFGDFIPGRIYVTKSNPECGLGGVFGRIYEFDPLTSNWRLFADLPGFCSLAGMTFTPEGKLRVAGFQTSTILEFDGDGSWKVVLNESHGIHLPGANNNIAYDKNGNFFVSQGIAADSNIMKFPGGQPPGSIFANLASGMTGTAPIAVAPDGSIYYRPTFHPGPNPYAAILKYAPDGSVSLFDVVGSVFVTSLAADSAGNLYVATGSGLYRYANGDPGQKSLVTAEVAFDADWGIALSPDAKVLYTAGGVSAIDLLTGKATLLGTFPPQPISSGWGKGIAVYVPEPPSMLSILFLFLPRCTRREDGRRQ